MWKLVLYFVESYLISVINKNLHTWLSLSIKISLNYYVSAIFRDILFQSLQLLRVCKCNLTSSNMSNSAWHGFWGIYTPNLLTFPNDKRQTVNCDIITEYYSAIVLVLFIAMFKFPRHHMTHLHLPFYISAVRNIIMSYTLGMGIVFDITILNGCNVFIEIVYISCLFYGNQLPDIPFTSIINDLLLTMRQESYTPTR